MTRAAVLPSSAPHHPTIPRASPPEGPRHPYHKLWCTANKEKDGVILVRARSSETERDLRRWGWRRSDKGGGEGESTTRGEVNDSPPWLPLPFHQPVERILSHIAYMTFVARHARAPLRLESLDAGVAQRRCWELSSLYGGGNGRRVGEEGLVVVVERSGSWWG